MTNQTQQLADFSADIHFERLPIEVVQQSRRFLLDAIGCGIAALKEDPRKAGIAHQMAGDFACAGIASVIGSNQTHPAFAAFANGMLMNAADNDDTHKRALAHIGSVVVPSAMAMTESTGGNGRRLIEAMVAGYEVAARVGMAVMPTHYRYWHSTATNGTFGAAAAAARAIGLTADQMNTALGLAGTQAAGLNTFFESGDDTKSIHPGKAGLNGVLAARLAQLGASSPPDILGHPKGYLAAFSLEPHPGFLTEGLGTQWEILQNGFKFYPSILASHSPIGAALELASMHRPDPTRIDRVTVHTYATVKSHFSNKQVANTMAARLSVPYCVAVALIDGEVGQRQFQPARLIDPSVKRVLDRTEIVADPALTALYPEKFPARVEVQMKDGPIFSVEKFYPKGDPNNPLTDEELRHKFQTNAAGCLPPSEIVHLIDLIDSIDAQESLFDLSALIRKARRS